MAVSQGRSCRLKGDTNAESPVAARAICGAANASAKVKQARELRIDYREKQLEKRRGSTELLQAL